MTNDLLPSISGCLTSGALTYACVRLASKSGALDSIAEARAAHPREMSRTGGIGIVGGLILAVAVTMLFGNVTSEGSVLRRLPASSYLSLLTLGESALIVFVVGLIDERRGIRAPFKLAALIIAAAYFAGYGTILGRSFYSDGQLSIVRFGCALGGVTWIVLVVAAFKFVDGLDRLAGGLACLGLLFLSMIGASLGVPVVTWLGAMAASALVGFLWQNRNPAKACLGEAGSLTVGFLVGALSLLCLLASPTGPTGFAVLAAVAIPMIDFPITIARGAIVTHCSIFTAERAHLHRRLLDRGWIHHHATRVLAWHGLLIGIGGILVQSSESRAGALCGALLGIAAAANLARVTGLLAPKRYMEVLRRAIDASADARRLRRAYEATQRRLRQARNVGEWWSAVSELAGAFGLARLKIELPRRDASVQSLEWTSPACCEHERDGGDDSIVVKFPVAQRRKDCGPLTAEVTVAANVRLDTCGERLKWLARLFDEHGLARLAADSSSRSAHRRFRIAAADGRLSTARHDALLKLGTWQRDTTRLDLPPRRSAHAPAQRATCSIPSMRSLRVAVVHDFLYTYGGAERVVEHILAVFPQADVFALFDFLPDSQRHFLGGRKVKTSFLQHAPFARRNHRMYLPIMPLAIEGLDVRGYDLVISSSYCVAKGVLTTSDQVHVSYCHSPGRFAWDLQAQHIGDRRARLGLSGSLLASLVLQYFRLWDARTADAVDHFVVNSDFVGRRVQKCYRRESTTVYPPVDTRRFAAAGDGETETIKKEDFYVVVTRLVPYKRIDLVIDAFNRMPRRKLVVIGEGPEMSRLALIAGPNVQLMGFQDESVVRDHLRRARGFVFPAEEDFGIAPVEAMACGTPVIGLDRGGLRETVVPRATGILMPDQTVESIIAAVEESERVEWDAAAISDHASRFGVERFRVGLAAVVSDAWAKAHRGRLATMRMPSDPPSDQSLDATADSSSGGDKIGAHREPAATADHQRVV